MPSGDHTDANDVSLSDLETQFVDQPGDEDVLWAVQEITAERGNKYKVKWVGVDPDTGKPWAQSWVAKHDCTNDLVIQWKARKKRLAAGKKRGRRTSTASRASGASKQAGSSTSGTRTRRSKSKVTSSRTDSVEQHVSPPAVKKSTLATKRKRQPETPATTTTTTATTSSAGQVDEKSEEGESRPRKKQKTILEVLLPPISSDEEADALRVPAHRGKATVQTEVARKGNGASSDVSDEDDSSPPKAKGKSERRSDARSKGAAAGSKASEESRSPQSNTKSKDVPRHRDRVTHADVASSDFEDLRPPKLKQKSTPKRKSPSEPQDDVSEKEVEPTAQPIKIGPPRGVKRREILRESRAPSKPGPSWTKPQEDGSADERVPAEQSISELDHEVSSSGDPLSRPQDAVGDRAFPPTHISIPQVPPNAPRHSHDLSPGALARLELFDRMVLAPIKVQTESGHA
ncbi:hypothetical protein V8E55_008283 [Tylopilus felleus]